jgi:hypothetical protein
MPSVGESAFRGLTQGFVQGTQLGLQIKEQQAKVDARLAEIQKGKEVAKQQDFENKLKLGTQLTDAYNVNTEAGQKMAIEGTLQLYRDMGYPVPKDINVEGVDFSAPMKELTNALKGFTGKTTAGGNKELLFSSIDSAFDMASKILPEDRLESFEKRAGERIEGAQEEFQGQQAVQASALGRLTPESAGISQEEITTARDVAASRAGQLEVGDTTKAPTLSGVKSSVLEKAITSGIDSLNEAETAIYKSIVEGKGVSVNIDNRKPGSPTERIKVAEARANLDGIKNIKSLFKPEFVGPLEGRTGTIRAKTKITKEEAKFRSAVKTNAAELKRFYFGTAQTATELRNSIEAIPDVNMSDELFQASLEETEKNIERGLFRTIESVFQSGLRPPVDTNAQTPQGNTPAPTVSFDARFNQLVEEGNTKEEAFTIMKGENF